MTSLVTLFNRNLELFKNSSNGLFLRIFNELLSTPNIARFARNVEWDFFCDFQILCRSLNDEKAVFNLCFEHAKMVCCCHFSTFLKIWKWTFYQNNNHYEKWIQDCRCRYARILRQMWRNSKPYKIRLLFGILLPFSWFWSIYCRKTLW